MNWGRKINWKEVERTLPPARCDVLVYGSNYDYPNGGYFIACYWPPFKYPNGEMSAGMWCYGKQETPAYQVTRWCELPEAPAKS